MKAIRFLLTLAVLALCLTPAYGFAGSTIATGTQRLLEDVSKWLVVLSPISAGAVCVYFIIRRGMADEQEGKMWQHRIVTAIVCGVGGMLAGGIISLVSSYYVT